MHIEKYTKTMSNTKSVVKCPCSIGKPSLQNMS